MLSELINPTASLLTVLESNARLVFITPNISMAPHVLLTLSVSVASGEQNFLKLKLVKDYLKSATFRKSLLGSALNSIENDIAKKLRFHQLVKALSANTGTTIPNIK